MTGIGGPAQPVGVAGPVNVAGATVRPYHPDDLAAVSDVCMRTGAAGGDARGLYRDHDLLPDTFARPYLVAEPELGFVLDDGGRAVGYILGTADTPRFARWFRQDWLPTLADRHPPAAPAPASGPPDWHAIMTRALYQPERMVWPELAAYPAHLHANLLPEYQRRGFGRQLMGLFLGALREQGVTGVHLAHGKFNISARVFYKRVGFEPLAVPDPDAVRYVGRSTAL
jgi:GNAT superfamily N-acetyltransferase